MLSSLTKLIDELLAGVGSSRVEAKNIIFVFWREKKFIIAKM